MVINQVLSVAIIALMMAAFVWGRFRYDLVACSALLAALAAGVVPYDAAFSGFSNDIVVIVGSALLVSAGVARSGIMEFAVQRYAPNVTVIRAQLLLLVAVVTILSAFVKNIGALAIMIPIAFQFARKSNTSPSVFLMPMAFGSLIGGLMTQIGTSPNIVVSQMREDITGTAFTMFDFTPVGAALALAGIVFLALFYWLVPLRTRAAGSIHEALDVHNYVTEARVVTDSAINGRTVADLLKYAGGDVVVTSILRSRVLRITPLPDAVLREGDILLIEGPPEALDRVVAQAKLSVTGSREAAGDEGSESSTAIEAVIGEHSSLIGWSAQQLALYDRFSVNLLAVSRKGERISERLGAVTLRLGDVLVLQGNPQRLPESCANSAPCRSPSAPSCSAACGAASCRFSSCWRRWAPPPAACCQCKSLSSRRRWPWCCSGSFPPATSTMRSTGRSWSCSPP